MRPTIARYGDEHGIIGQVERRGGHYYVVTYEPAWSPRAGERISWHATNRVSALDTLQRMFRDDYENWSDAHGVNENIWYAPEYRGSRTAGGKA